MLSQKMGDSSADNENDRKLMVLPPGFRFHPTDEEVISCYLSQKVFNTNFTSMAIAEADLNKCEPWDLPKRAKIEEKELYFFCQRDRKYPTGTRTNRATENGYWKATGKDREIVEAEGNIVGMKKTLVFYGGRAPSGHKTNWVMHEYRLQGNRSPYSTTHPAKDDWVVCKVFHKETAIKKDFPSEYPWMNVEEPHEMQMGSSSSSRIFQPGPTLSTLSNPNMFMFPQSMPQDDVVCFQGCPHSADYFHRQKMPTTLPCNCTPSYSISAFLDGDVPSEGFGVGDNDEISPVGLAKNEAGSLHGLSGGDELGDDQKEQDIMADFDDLWCG